MPRRNHRLSREDNKACIYFFRILRQVLGAACVGNVSPFRKCEQRTFSSSAARKKIIAHSPLRRNYTTNLPADLPHYFHASQSIPRRNERAPHLLKTISWINQKGEARLRPWRLFSELTYTRTKKNNLESLPFDNCFLGFEGVFFCRFSSQNLEICP